MAIEDLPYRRIKAGIDYIKKRWYTKEWNNRHSYHFGMSDTELETRLRANHFEGMYLSYYYNGQTLDVRRPEVGKNGRALELHLRARPADSASFGSDIMAHIEASRYEAKTDHINGVGSRWLTHDEIANLIMENKTPRWDL